MILSFIEVPLEMLKTSGFAFGFQHLPRDLANVNEWKIIFDPYIIVDDGQALLFVSSMPHFFPKLIVMF